MDEKLEFSKFIDLLTEYIKLFLDNRVPSKLFYKLRNIQGNRRVVYPLNKDNHYNWENLL